MKLSEAIRLGAMMHPQTYNDVADYTAGGRVRATCAVGGAYLAAGVTEQQLAARDYASVPQWLRAVIDGPLRSCPSCGRLCVDLGHAITHLNDAHRFTREQIADWVETLEREQERTVAPTAEAVTA